MPRLIVAYRKLTSCLSMGVLVTSEIGDMAHLSQVALVTHMEHLTQNSSLTRMVLLTQTPTSLMAVLTQTPTSAG